MWLLPIKERQWEKRNDLFSMLARLTDNQQVCLPFDVPVWLMLMINQNLLRQKRSIDILGKQCPCRWRRSVRALMRDTILTLFWKASCTALSKTVGTNRFSSHSFFTLSRWLFSKRCLAYEASVPRIRLQATHVSCWRIRTTPTWSSWEHTHKDRMKNRRENSFCSLHRNLCSKPPNNCHRHFVIWRSREMLFRCFSSHVAVLLGLIIDRSTLSRPPSIGRLHCSFETEEKET